MQVVIGVLSQIMTKCRLVCIMCACSCMSVSYKLHVHIKMHMQIRNACRSISVCIFCHLTYPTCGVHTSIFRSHRYSVVIMLGQCYHGHTIATLLVKEWTNEGLH